MAAPPMSGDAALVAATAFASAAAYVSLVEQPARAGLPDDAALAQWKPSYKRAAVMQGCLALGGAASAGLAWRASGDRMFAVGGALCFANWPWTLAAIMPTNRRLLALEGGGPESRSLLATWGRLHAVRTALGLAATGVLFAAVRKR